LSRYRKADIFTLGLRRFRGLVIESSLLIIDLIALIFHRDLCKLHRSSFETLLFSRFSFIYRQKSLSPSQTCMCWGIDTGPGWYKILWDLSKKIALEVKKTRELQKPYLILEGKNNNELFRSSKFIIASTIFLFNKYFLRKDLFFIIDGFYVSQVKEKYGTLRFYCGIASDAIYSFIDEAEVASVETCEACGKSSKEENDRKKNTPETGGWVYNECTKCKKKREDKTSKR